MKKASKFFKLYKLTFVQLLSVKVHNQKKEIVRWLTSGFSSIIVHIIGFILLMVVTNLTLQSAMINPAYYTIEFHQTINSESLIEDEIAEDEPVDINKPEETVSTQQFSFTDINADTTNLDQLYKESTLNVSIKYPKGWTFIDQNVKNKLDGVTFWASDGLYNPPPYIHLEVKEKYYFNEQKYKYQIEFDDCIAYYNDPEIIEDYYIQNVYLRTEVSEDFNIKLMMVGEEAFKSFQPKFFGMIKTFDFGSSFF